MCQVWPDPVRLFTVGVGSSVLEAFVQTLALSTGGACELLSPHEEMAERSFGILNGSIFQEQNM